VSGLILVLLSKTKESCFNDGGGLFLVDCGDERQIKKSLSGKRRSSEEIKRLVLQYEASGSRPGPNSDYTVDDLRSLVSVNIEGFLFNSQFAIKHMLAQKTRRKQRQYHVDAGHLALDTAADEITARVRGFVGS
jgi:NADP-dependent 3-hydroxy acid dehydrogenase YdfG